MFKNPSIFFVSFLQAVGLSLYIGTVAAVISGASQLFNNVGPVFWGPVMGLSLFSVSALICALLVGAYPFWVIWEKKQTARAIKILIATAAWFLLFVILIVLRIAFLKT